MRISSPLPVFDRGRTAELAALVCCGLLALLVLWLCGRLVWALVPRDDTAFDTRAPHSAADAQAVAQSASIARWHLFGQTPSRPGSGPGAPATTLSLILRGTFAGADPKSGIAVIADAGDGERAYRVGDEISAGVRLARVHADHVVLAHDGIEETLTLPRDSNLAPADAVRPTPATVTGRAAQRVAAATTDSSPAQATAGAPAGREQVIRAPSDWQQTVAQLQQNPADLMRRVQIVPVLDGTRITGMRLAAGSDSALIGRIGLLPGDVVTSVNGRPVDSLASGQQIMASLANAASVRVTVLRNGKPTDITVGLK